MSNMIIMPHFGKRFQQRSFQWNENIVNYKKEIGKWSESEFMEQELEIIQGAVTAVVYQNYDNGYAVLRLNVGGGQNVTVVGTIPMPSAGERLMVTGKWSSHPSYGRQFEAEFLERLMPQTETEILAT